MQIRFNLVFILATLFLLSSCSSNEEKLIGKWDVKYVEPSNAEELAKIFKGRVKANMKEKAPGNMLILNPDKTYFFSFGIGHVSISFGTWTLDNTNDTLRLVFSPADEQLPYLNSLKILDLDSKELTAQFGSDVESLNTAMDMMSFNYEKKDDKFDQSEYKVFTTPKLNMWRIKASQEQSEEQIKQRLRDALDFAIAYLHYNIEIESKSTPTQVIDPLPILFASNGIAVEPNDKWERLFFDQSEAESSYRILRQAFDDIKEVYIDEDLQKSPLKGNTYLLECLVKVLD